MRSTDPSSRSLREPVELGDIARRVSGLLALKAADHQITLISPDEDIKCVVVGEFRRVLQIVLNLVGNAIRYSPGGHSGPDRTINPTAATYRLKMREAWNSGGRPRTRFHQI
jgi:signal transduction histidine kinase